MNNHDDTRTESMNPTFLVTGGVGFIGAWVVRELLERRCGVVVMDIAAAGRRWMHLAGPGARDIRFVRADILDEGRIADTLDAHGISHVIHLVGLLTPDCQRDPVRGCEVNVLGTIRLLDLLRERRDRIRGFAYASSYAVHGPAAGVAWSPETFYGAFKRATELIAGQYARHFALNSVGLRPFVVYGAGRETGLSAAPSLAARAAAWGESYEFGFSGAAGLVYVEDVAKAFVRSALEAPEGSHVIDMPGDQASMETVITILDRLQPGARARLALSGPPLPSTREENPFLIERLFPDWRSTPLEEGLRRTVRMWRELRQQEP